MPKVKCSYKPCGKRFEKGTGRSYGMLNWCSEDCQVSHAMASKDKGKKIKEKQEKADNRRRKKEFYARDIKTRREAAVYWFNRFVRLRDAGSPCISCGTRNPNIKYDAGHFVPAGRCTALRFNEANTNLQCSVQCNQHLSGNRSNYRFGIIEKYGEEVLRFLEGPQPKIKITAEWYKSIEDKYKAKVKELENERERQVPECSGSYKVG